MTIITIKKDALFNKLLWLNFKHNYLKVYHDNKKVGDEYHKLYSFLLIKDLPDAQKYATRKIKLAPWDESFLEKYFLNKNDGTYVMLGNEISQKMLMDRLTTNVSKKFGMSQIDPIIETFLPPAYLCPNETECTANIGGRTMTALCAALLGDEKTVTYKISQTVYGCSTGKLSKFTKDGLHADAFFQRYEAMKYKVADEFNCYSYGMTAGMVLYSDLYVIRFYHFLKEKKRLVSLGEFVVKPKELEDYYNGKAEKLKFYKKSDVVKERKDNILKKMTLPLRNIKIRII